MLTPEDIQPPFAVGELELEGQELWTPYMAIQFGGEIVHLHHFNSTVRLFKNEDANHVELRTDEGLKGIRMAQYLIKQMVDYEYDYVWNRVVDEESAEFLAQIDASDLEAEWEQYDLEAE